MEEVHARADDRYAVGHLADLLAWQGRGEEAERLRRFGLNPDGSTASGWRTVGAVSCPACYQE